MKTRILLIVGLAIIGVSVGFFSLASPVRAQSVIGQGKLCPEQDYKFFVTPGLSFTLAVAPLSSNSHTIYFDLRDEYDTSYLTSGELGLQPGNPLHGTFVSHGSGNITLMEDADADDILGYYDNCLTYSITLTSGGKSTLQPTPKPTNSVPGDIDPADFVSQDDGFAVLFTGKPDRTTQPVLEQGKKLTEVLYSYQNTTIVEIIGITDYSTLLPVTMTSSAAQTFLDNVRQGILSSISATEVSHTKITLDDYPGQAFTANVGQLVVKCRMYLVDGQVYILLGMTKSGNESDVDDFLDSFRLLNSVATPTTP